MREAFSKSVPTKIRGAALVAITWLLLILAIMAAATMATVRERLAIVSADEIRSAVRLAAEGAIYQAIHQYIASTTGVVSEPIGDTFQVGEYSVNVKVNTESGLININRANRPLLSAAFAAQGIDERRSLALASAIMDWRDADNLKQFDGAESSDYRSAGLDYFPRNSPFETLGELVQVKGMTSGLYRCVSPLFTVYSSSPDVSLSDASEEVKKVFDWAANHNWQEGDWTMTENNRRSVIKPGGRSAAGNAFSFVATTQGERDIPFSLRAVIRFTSDSARPFQILLWEEVFIDDVVVSDCDTKNSD